MYTEVDKMMKLYIRLFILMCLLSSCVIQYSSLDIETNENLELIKEFDNNLTTYDIITISEGKRAFALSKRKDTANVETTTLTDKERDWNKVGYKSFVLKEIKEDGLEEYYAISCLGHEEYFTSYAKDNKLFLFSCINSTNHITPFSVFLRIIDIENKKLIEEKVLSRKYLANVQDWEFTKETKTYSPSIKVSPNKNYFALYMAHEAGNMMNIWTVDIFDERGERVFQKILDRVGSIDFSIRDDGSLWLTGMYSDNYNYVYNVEHISDEIVVSDSYEVPHVANKDKTNEDMLIDFEERPEYASKFKYHEFYYPTNQKILENDSELLFFNYVYASKGNGGLIATRFNKNDSKIEDVSLIPYHEILDSALKNNNNFYAKFIPELQLSNVIEHNGDYYLILESFTKQILANEVSVYLVGTSGDKYIIALDNNLNVKWANALLASHMYFMTWSNYTDDYSLQGASKFEIKDGKLSGIVSCEFEGESFITQEMGYFRINYDLETGKILDKKFLIDRNGNSKVYYNYFYPLNDMSIIIDQNFKSEFYLIKEK